jgi:Uma2 family endonuclease
MEYLIKTNAIGGMTEEQFFKFCQENDSIRFERNTNGEIIIMAPTGSDTSWFNSNLNRVLSNWNHDTKLGFVFESNAGFTLPNNAVRSPDAAFISKQKWLALSQDDRKKFAHVCPDFVIELLSESDNPKALQDKMKEWIDNGCRLAWMINPQKKETLIYRDNGEVEIRSFALLLEGENVLPGFKVDLKEIFIEEF